MTNKAQKEFWRRPGEGPGGIHLTTFSRRVRRSVGRSVGRTDSGGVARTEGRMVRFRPAATTAARKGRYVRDRLKEA